MYKNILIPLDNSDFSNMGIDIGIKLAQKCGAQITGSHVYAARLHDVRFRQMESGLPKKYLQEEELEKQRDIHDSLITKGLEVITDSYLDAFEKKCHEAKMTNFKKRSLEGKNYKAIVEDVEKNKHDLVTIGSLGLGAVKESAIGSVCERVVRKVKVDTLVIKNSIPMNGGKIVVAVDGSPQSYGGLLTGIEIGKYFNKKVAVISAFDPYFHYVAFNSIAGILSQESAEVFKFKEQEKLHEDIIDSGLAKIYKTHLEISKQVAEKHEVEIETKLLDGKAFEKILQYVKEENPWLLIMGKIGIHSDDEMDIGSNTENILRKVNCHVLVSSKKYMPPIEETAKINIVWTEEAEKRMEKVPSFVRGMAKMAVLNFASEKGHTVVTADVVSQATQSLLPESAQKAMGIITEEAIKQKMEKEKRKKTIAASAKKEEKEEIAFDGKKFAWEKNALKRLENIPAGVMRDNVKLRIEKYARAKGIDLITEENVSQDINENKKKMDGMADMISKMQEASPNDTQKSKLETNFKWTAGALARLNRVPEGFMRNMTKGRVEQYAAKIKVDQITLEIAENGLSQAKETMTSMMGNPSTATPPKAEIPLPENKGVHIDDTIDYYYCDICGYTLKGHAPEECPVCRAAKEKFMLVGNKKELLTPSSGRILDWTSEAKKRLANIPEGFMREMTKWRIEAFVRKSGSLAVNEELIEQKYQNWAEGSQKADKELAWDEEASKKIEKIPSFVRGMVIKEVENEAKRKGYKTISLKTLAGVRDKWKNSMEFHAEFNSGN